MNIINKDETNPLNTILNKEVVAVAYVRVSTDHEDQLNSFENQLKFWTEYIKGKGWTFGGLYADEGISGTSTKKRNEFNRMISDAAKGKFNLVCTKSVQRFARNTVDCLQYTRYLKSLSIGVYFQLDNIYTLDNDGELRISIMATLAQEESRKISENVKWGHKRAMQNGIVYGANRVLGYDIVDKKLVINPEEAEIVKKIYNWFLEGESLHNIIRLLEGIGITKGKLGGKLFTSSIRRILSNEKYCGILKQGKYITEDFLTHKRTKNKTDNFHIITDNHEPIIDKETWHRVQHKLTNNRKEYEEYSKGYSKNIWSNKISCECCGQKYRRKTYKNKDGSPRPAYICSSYYDKGTKGCSNGTYLREEILENMFMHLLNKIIDDNTKTSFINNFISVLEKNISTENSLKEIESLNKQLEKIKAKKTKLLDAYLDEDIPMSKEDYNSKNKDLTNQEQEIIKQINIFENQSAYLSDKKKKIEKFYEIVSQGNKFETFNKELVEVYLDKITANKYNLKFHLTLGQFDMNYKEYPKESNNTNYCNIMDTKYRYDINRTLNRYIDYDIEVYIAV